MARPGYIYVIRMAKGFQRVDSVYKIGKTVNVDQRFKQITPTLPYPSSVLLTIRTPDIDSMERSLHQRYADCRLEGEWFDLKQEYIVELIDMAGGGKGGCVCQDYNPRCPYSRSCNPNAF